MSSPAQVRCRQIQTSDFDAVEDVLTRGFKGRSRKYWTKALESLRARQRPSGCPEFGYLLEVNGAVVGVHLLIFSTDQQNPDGPLRCNTSSWCVDPAYRGYAAILASVASKLKDVTYLNTSPAKHTWPIIESVGYRRYSQGQFAAFPALSRGPAGAVSELDASAACRALPDYALLQAHGEAGCLVLICQSADGPAPFVFQRRHIAYAPVGVMQLIYCRDTASFAACARPLGWFLLGRRTSCVICDADGPIAGLPGFYFADKTPRYFKGPDRPRQNDLAYTEMVLFGP